MIFIIEMNIYGIPLPINMYELKEIPDVVFYNVV